MQQLPHQTINQIFTMRERLIIAQALAIGIQELRRVPTPMTEVSNILDMEWIAENYFNEFFGVAQFLLSKTNNINQQFENQLKD